ALAAVLPVIERRQHFNFVLELSSERIPPRPARPKLNPKCAALFRSSKIDSHLWRLAFVPEQSRRRSGAARIRRPRDAIGELVTGWIAGTPLSAGGNRNGVRLASRKIFPVR